ncbi:hypothetical protein [Paraburkholderia graminis]|uniref:Uncharacterized protein n=1 Tax=Paraburkholderia graminis TaxID=60548 RepID=A0ABD5CB47_9BURK|nr:hypothetical protein [Paraburkholderia graminis]MDR6202504.1 hypothetical protein [Paraburkholderia graminis]
MPTTRQTNGSSRHSKPVPASKLAKPVPLPKKRAPAVAGRATNRAALSTHGAESKSLLESLGVLDDLMQRRGLANQRAALLGYKQSILTQLSLIHGLDASVVTQSELSGPAWVARFPDSRSTAQLERTFKTGVDAFIASMTAAGASVSVNPTYRPVERAYLMHYAYAIATGEVSPKDVPAQQGVDIQWDHGDLAASKAAAQQMVDVYGIVKEPSLHSRHTE